MVCFCRLLTSKCRNVPLFTIYFCCCSQVRSVCPSRILSLSQIFLFASYRTLVQVQQLDSTRWIMALIQHYRFCHWRVAVWMGRVAQAPEKLQTRHGKTLRAIAQQLEGEEHACWLIARAQVARSSARSSAKELAQLRTHTHTHNKNKSRGSEHNSSDKRSSSDCCRHCCQIGSGAPTWMEVGVVIHLLLSAFCCHVMLWFRQFFTIIFHQ